MSGEGGAVVDDCPAAQVNGQGETSATMDAVAAEAGRIRVERFLWGREIEVTIGDFFSLMQALLRPLMLLAWRSLVTPWLIWRPQPTWESFIE